MIHDLRTELPPAQHISDVCVVGAGAAGITLAVLLSRAGRSVTLVEAGGITGETGDDPPSAHASGLPYRGIVDGRAQALGGTTTLWGGQILPLNTLDFERRPWVAGSGWPLRRSDLQHFYTQALEIEGLTESLHSDDAVWSRIGEQSPQFPGLHCYFSRWCPQPNFAVLHANALASKEVDVWLHAKAVRLCRTDAVVRGVVVRSPQGEEHTFRGSHVVFCLGAIESSRFFLQPLEGGHPWNDSGLLGCHFQDHVDCDAATLLPLHPERLSRTFDSVFLKGLKYMPKLRLADAEQRRHEVLNVGGTVYAHEENNAMLQVRQDARKLLRGELQHFSGRTLLRAAKHAPAVAQETVRFVINHRSSLPTRKPLTLRVHCEQEPSGTSRIRLSQQRDALGLFRAEVNWQVSDAELRTIRTFTDVVSKALQPIAKLVPHPDLYAHGRKFVAACQDSFHHMGGMRMHSSPRLGVVDEDLRLHGTQNCYVCSAAVFPTSGFSNPTHTLLALAARLSDHLLH